MKQLILLSIIAFLFSCTNSNTYYIDVENGNDDNSGQSPKSAWASLEKVNALILLPGDKVLFATGSTFMGTIILENVSGTKENPIVISSYESEGNNKLPVIDSKRFANGVLLVNCSHVIVSNIEITGDGSGVATAKNAKQNMHCGVLITTSEPNTFENIQLKNLVIQDVFFEKKGFKRGKDEVRTANGSQSYGWGIRVINSTKNAVLQDILVENCEIKNVAHTGIKFTGRDKSIHNIKLYNNSVYGTGGPGIQMSGVNTGHVKNNHVNRSGSNNDSRKWGRGSGLWTWSSSDVIIENNSFRNANGPGDSAGCHIDFNCNNVIVQYNLSENNAGGFCEILGNNYNCAYRYNVSINDGHRVKGENRAFQEGKIFWLSGFNGKGKKRNGPFNSYFFNNTVYVKKDVVAKIAVDRASSGVLIANNIFYIEGESQAVKGDQYKPETEGESRVENIVFQNNLYLKKGNWPVEVLIQDENPIFGNPNFVNIGGIELKDYIPKNVDLTKNKGIRIEPLSNDSIGLFIGLSVAHDILGNEIMDLPDLGAIEIK
jgi:hypothetical protein